MSTLPHKLFTTSLLTLGLSLASTTQSETLLEIYQQALLNDHQYRAAQANYEASKEVKNIERAGLLPQINGSAEWSSTTSDQHSNLGCTDPCDPNTSEDWDRSGYSVSLSQPLFDLAAWHGYKAGTKQAKKAEAGFKLDQQALIVRTATAYFDVLKAIDNFNTAVAEETAFEHQLKQTKQRFEVGLTAITEVHEVQSAFDSATANRLLAEGQVGISFEALEVITGQPYNAISPLKTTFPVSQPTPLARQDWEQLALDNNFSLTAAKLNSETFKHKAKQAKSAHLPTIKGSFLVSNYDDERSVENSSPYLDSSTDSQMFKLELSVPIFSGGRTSASRRQATKSYIAADETYRKTKRDIVQETRSVHLKVLTGVATVKARKQAITSSKSALEATQAGYDVGTRDLVDVLQAQRNLYRAQRDYYDTLYTFVVNNLKLKEVAGILTEKNIVELDLWLDQAKNVKRVR